MKYTGRELFWSCLYFYNKGYNQRKTAKELGINCRKAKFLLEKGKITPGYLNININSEPRYCLEIDLITKYKLKNAIIVTSRNQNSKKGLDRISFDVGIEGSAYILNIIKKIYSMKKIVSIGIGHGTIFKHLIDNLSSNSKIPLSICALFNDPFEDIIEKYPEYKESRAICLINQLRGKFPRPAEEQSVYDFPRNIPHNLSEYENLRSQTQSIKIFRKYEELDIALFGLGSLREGTAYYNLVKYFEHLDKKPYLEFLNRHECVGALGGSIPINQNGYIKSELSFRVLGIDLKFLESFVKKENKFSILAAHGTDRLKGIQTIISMGYANVLVTDSLTAKSLLDS